jgi:hypothetical protein
MTVIADVLSVDAKVQRHQSVSVQCFVEPKFIIGRALMPEQLSNSNPHALDEVEQCFPVWWCFQIFNGGRFNTSVANEAESGRFRAVFYLPH